MSWILEGKLGTDPTASVESDSARSDAARSDAARSDAARSDAAGPGATGTARVEFFRAGDRIAHRVSIERAGQSRTWESIEGNDLQNWPPSPAYQEVSLERIGDQDVALLVGMAGKSHWSLSVDIDPVRASVRFDVACRIAVEPEFLGSKYRGDPDSVICDSATIIDKSAGAAPEDFPGDFPEDSSTADVWCARPQSIAAPRATIRWSYEFS